MSVRSDRKFPAMPELLAERVSFAREQLANGKVEMGALRFPVSVDQDTRNWLECQAYALNMSLSGLAGMILQSVARQDMAPDENGNLR